MAGERSSIFLPNFFVSFLAIACPDMKGNREKKKEKEYKLNLFKAGLSEFSMIIFEFPNLVELNLWYNNFSTIPDNIRQLKNLKYLYIGDNPNLTELPNSICALQNLEV